MAHKNAKELKRESKISILLAKSGLFDFAKNIRKIFPKAKIYLVGGYLRDIILSRNSKDIDLVVSGVPAKNLEKFLKKRGLVNLVGKTFGVFKFTAKKGLKNTIDIALPRKEHAFGSGGYRDFEVQSDWRIPIEKDLARRDFTVNAMAWDILEKKLIDPHHGLDDIDRKVVKAVGDPAERFGEDYSRMLRALRFACQLNFEIENKTWLSIKKLIRHLNKVRRNERVVPYEIVAKEILKSFLANPVAALDIFDKAGAIKILIPELLTMKKCPQPPPFHSEGDVWTHTRLALEVLVQKKFKNLFGEPNAEMIMMMLFHDIGKPATITYPKIKNDRIRFNGHDKVGAVMVKKIAERLRLSSYKDEKIDVDTDRLFWLVNNHLLLVSDNPRNMKATTIEKYYLKNELLGKELLAMNFADASASITSDGSDPLAHYKIIKNRIKEILGKRKTTLPPPLVNGDEIMKLLKLKPGPEVGKIIEQLREFQLQGKIKTKKQALDYLKI